MMSRVMRGNLLGFLGEAAADTRFASWCPMRVGAAWHSVLAVQTLRCVAKRSGGSIEAGFGWVRMTQERCASLFRG